jgi:hypothetical protein
VVAHKHPDLSGIDEREVRGALARILASKYFAHAPKRQKFLRLVCEFYLSGRASELNEYLIGCEVFDRKESYNPATDPIVRVGAHEIRKKLESYYQREGAKDQIRLDIPVGGYEPFFSRHEPTKHREPAADHPSTTDTLIGETETAPIVPISNLAVVVRQPVKLYLLAIVGLLICVLVLGYNNLEMRKQLSQTAVNDEQSSYGHVWEPILKSSEPALLVLSNPVVYRLLNAGDSENVIKESVGLTKEQTDSLNSALSDYFAVRNSPPNPRLVLSFDTYTGMGEAIGVQRVTDLLRTAGKQVLLKRSRTVTAEDLKAHQVVFLGSVWANEWSGKLSLHEDFVVTGQATIENLDPRAGEDRVYRSTFDDRTGLLVEDYALVTMKSSITEAGVMMVLAGLRSAGTEAAAEYVTSKNHLNELNERLSGLNESGQPPKFYQVLLRVGVENGIPTTITPVAIHELDAVKN